MSRFITRKEIASANELDERTVRRHERRLGLHEVRDRACQRPVRYPVSAAAPRLRQHGWQCPED